MEELPVKQHKTQQTFRYFHYFLIRQGGQTYINKRTAKDIWKNLYDFPCIESHSLMEADEVVQTEAFKQLIDNKEFTITKTSPVFTHKLTHRTLLARFVEIKLSQELLHIETKGLILTPERDLGNYPIPRLIDLYLTT